VLPKVTTAIRATLTAEIGSIVYDTDLSKAFVASASTASTDSWEALN
jgi:hypothetical protein